MNTIAALAACINIAIIPGSYTDGSFYELYSKASLEEHLQKANDWLVEAGNGLCAEFTVFEEVSIPYPSKGCNFSNWGEKYIKSTGIVDFNYYDVALILFPYSGEHCTSYGGASGPWCYNGVPDFRLLIHECVGHSGLQLRDARSDYGTVETHGDGSTIMGSAMWLAKPPAFSLPEFYNTGAVTTTKTKTLPFTTVLGNYTSNMNTKPMFGGVRIELDAVEYFISYKTKLGINSDISDENAHGVLVHKHTGNGYIYLLGSASCFDCEKNFPFTVTILRENDYVAIVRVE